MERTTVLAGCTTRRKPNRRLPCCLFALGSPEIPALPPYVAPGLPPLLAHLPCIRAGANEAVRFQNGQPMSVDLLSVTAPRPNRA